ncbi:NAD(P)-binding protein [Penicillium soppii]|jgi:nucleoside-diphosphate-sugar epimerase|uniref:NAD(P)-binding protein n=1 Tax=Penicillium soppii TaxID=69789 RepID=UPI002547683D|nr:NAD(P)-binding protein [Penicillium soppii]KAJ5876184.1 NAD(P)-binding protein [Penicillium soppii]
MSSFAYSKGLIKSPHTREIDAETADRLTAHGSVLWGTNARISGDRARQLLGWSPQGPSLEEEIRRAILAEEAVSGDEFSKMLA